MIENNIYFLIILMTQSVNTKLTANIKLFNENSSASSLEFLPHLFTTTIQFQHLIFLLLRSNFRPFQFIRLISEGFDLLLSHYSYHNCQKIKLNLLIFLKLVNLFLMKKCCWLQFNLKYWPCIQNQFGPDQILIGPWSGPNLFM